MSARRNVILDAPAPAGFVEIEKGNDRYFAIEIRNRGRQGTSRKKSGPKAAPLSFFSVTGAERGRD